MQPWLQWLTHSQMTQLQRTKEEECCWLWRSIDCADTALWLREGSVAAAERVGAQRLLCMRLRGERRLRAASAVGCGSAHAPHARHGALREERTRLKATFFLAIQRSSVSVTSGDSRSVCTTNECLVHSALFSSLRSLESYDGLDDSLAEECTQIRGMIRLILCITF